MRRYRRAFILALFLGLLAWPLTTHAQPPDTELSIVIAGQIINGTPGGSVPANLSLMLHTYDGQTMTAMTDGVADAQGRFRFESVPMQRGRSFEVMVTYRDVAYFSQRVEPELGEPVLELPVTVYETTTATTTLRVGQLHLLLEFAPGSVQVMQLYILSNLGDRTIVVGDGKGVPFRLPAEARDVRFESDPTGARFMRTEDGFVDTAPIVPGEGTLPTLVRYTLPYTGEATLRIPIDYPTQRVSVLLPEVGVRLEDAAYWRVGKELLLRGQVHQVFDYERVPLTAGEVLSLRIVGQPAVTTSTSDPATMERPSVSLAREGGPFRISSERRRTVFLVGMALSLILIEAGGLWWWRNRLLSAVAASGTPPSERASLLQAIADLDDAYEAGAIDEGAYRVQRAHLRHQALALMRDRDAAAAE